MRFWDLLKQCEKTSIKLDIYVGTIDYPNNDPFTILRMSMLTMLVIKTSMSKMSKTIHECSEASTLSTLFLYYTTSPFV